MALVIQILLGLAVLVAGFIAIGAICYAVGRAFPKFSPFRSIHSAKHDFGDTVMDGIGIVLGVAFVICIVGMSWSIGEGILGKQEQARATPKPVYTTMTRGVWHNGVRIDYDTLYIDPKTGKEIKRP